MGHQERYPRSGEWYPSRERRDYDIKAPRIKPTAQGVLSCGCFVTFEQANLTLGSETFCRRCQKVVRVSSHAPEWVIHCDGCRYSRKYGQAKLEAVVYASKHANRKHHKVRVYCGAELVETIGQGKQLTFDDEPPF